MKKSEIVKGMAVRVQNWKLKSDGCHGTVYDPQHYNDDSDSVLVRLEGDNRVIHFKASNLVARPAKEKAHEPPKGRLFVVFYTDSDYDRDQLRIGDLSVVSDNSDVIFSTSLEELSKDADVVESLEQWSYVFIIDCNVVYQIEREITMTLCTE